MKPSILTILAAAVFAGLSVQYALADPVSLLDLPQTSGYHIEGKRSEVSIRDHIYPQFIAPDSGGWDANGENSALYNLHGDFTELTGTIGVPDDVTQFNEGNRRHYNIFVDGTSVVNGTVSLGDPPVPVKIDLTGAKSVRVTLSYQIVFADPLLTPAPKPVPGVPLLAFPKNGDTVTSKKIDLRWSAVKESVSYGIQLVCVRLAPGTHEVPAVYSFNATHPMLEVDASVLPPGTYTWQVIAFGAKKTLGSFSHQWTFDVDR